MDERKIHLKYWFRLFKELLKYYEPLKSLNHEIVCKIYDGSPWNIYMVHEVKDLIYIPVRDHIDMDIAYNILAKEILDNTGIFCCRLKKKEHGIRIRFTTDFGTTIAKILNKISMLASTSMPPVNIGITDRADIAWTYSGKEIIGNIVDKRKENKMNDFSIENIKNAVIRKVTSLDKKTVTLLGILVLLLLIATRYQDIKDILMGIKDKVKKSKNFKAMVADGTSAINGLKKIVGIKNDNGDDNE